MEGKGDSEEVVGIRYGCSGIVLCSEPVNQCTSAKSKRKELVGSTHASLNQQPRIDFEKVWLFDGALNLLLVWLEKDSDQCSGVTGDFP